MVDQAIGLGSGARVRVGPKAILVRRFDHSPPMRAPRYRAPRFSAEANTRGNISPIRDSRYPGDMIVPTKAP